MAAKCKVPKYYPGELNTQEQQVDAEQREKMKWSKKALMPQVGEETLAEYVGSAAEESLPGDTTLGLSATPKPLPEIRHRFASSS